MIHLSALIRLCGSKSALLSGALCYTWALKKVEKKDKVEAYKWYNLAVAHGSSILGVDMRNEIEKKMNGEEINKAQILTREFLAENPGNYWTQNQGRSYAPYGG